MPGASPSREYGQETSDEWINDGSQLPLPRSQEYLDRWSDSSAANSHAEIDYIAAGPSQYEYSDMAGRDTIRLIHLQPGSGNELLRLEIEHVRIDNAPKYEAISYVWGHGSDMWPVDISGPDTNRGQLRLKLNLFEALHEFRLSDRPRTIWADRICINQLDLEERSRQVQLMGKIFITGASSVLVWLGWDLRVSQRAIQAMEEWRINVKEYTGLSVAQKFASEPDRFREQLFFIESIGCNAWFSRVWTYQEAAGGNVHLIWNGFTISLSWWNELCWELCPDLVAIEQYRHIPTSLNRATIWHPRDQHGSALQLELVHAIETASELRATDPRDKVFALVNLVTQGDRELCIPDYTACTTDVFRRTTAACIDKTKSLEILDFVCHTLGQGHDLPSWVPDFAQGGSSCIYPAYPLGEGDEDHSGIHRRRYFATGNARVVAGFSESGFMSLTACRIGKIVDLVSKPLKSIHEVAGSWTLLADAITEEDAYMHTGEQTQNALQKMFEQCGGNPLGPPVSGYRSSTRGVESCRDWKLLRPDMQYDRIDMFITESRHMGICDPCARRDDEIFVALGGDHPLILRPVGDGTYKFVAIAYVHGMMRGEALIEARARLHPELDKTDFAWLMDLENMEPKDMPFDGETVTIV